MVRAAPFLLLALAGCANEPASAPQPAELLAASDRHYGGIERMPTPDLRRYCMSAYWAKQADKLSACLGEVASRRKWLGVSSVADCREGSHACDLLARELHLGALRALDTADYAEAIGRASELHAMHRERAGFRYEAVDALGALAVAHGLAGDRPAAEKYRTELERFGFGPFSGLHFERIWLARAAMAVRDYERAYVEVRRLDFGFDSLTERAAATYAPTGEADGYRFILGKSALETGRLEQAKAGFAGLQDSKALDASKTGFVVSPEEIEHDLARARGQNQRK